MSTRTLWTDTEWRAATDAYFEMLAMQDRREPFVKAHVVGELIAGPLRSRTKGSVEYLFGNISAILAEMQREWVVGYVPYRRYARGLVAVVRARGELRPVDEATIPTDDLDVLDARVAALLARHRLVPPPGQLQPAVRFVAGVRRIARDPVVRAWTLLTADGRCARCREVAPFVTARGLPYLEHHHLALLAAGGPDTPANSIAACPNCHRRLHYGVDRLVEMARLRAEAERIAAAS